MIRMCNIVYYHKINIEKYRETKKCFKTNEYSWAELILQPFRHFTYITTHSPTFPSFYLRHSSFSNPSVASPTSQLIFKPFRRFTYVTAQSPTLPLLHLRHSSVPNPSLASPTSQDLHLIHLASRPCCNSLSISGLIHTCCVSYISQSSRFNIPYYVANNTMHEA